MATDILSLWATDVVTGKKPVLYAVGSGQMARIRIGSGLVALFGGGPGIGKTALTMQLLADALRLSPALRAKVMESLRRAQDTCQELLTRIQDWQEFEAEVVGFKATLDRYLPLMEDTMAAPAVGR
jgi:hypothetical protein